MATPRVKAAPARALREVPRGTSRKNYSARKFVLARFRRISTNIFSRKIRGGHTTPTATRALMSVQEETPSRSAHIIVVGNEKGGSGKSTVAMHVAVALIKSCLLYTSPSPRDRQKSRMPSSA